MNFFSDFLAINKVVFKKSNGAYFKNLILVPMFGVYLLVFNLISLLLNMSIGRLGSAGFFLSGIMTWILSCYFISDYLTHLERAISGFRFSFKDVGKSYLTYFIPLLSATVIPNIIISIFYRLSGIFIPTTLLYIFYALYATPEIVYQKHVDRLELFVYGHKFLKENFKFWIILNACHGVLLMVVSFLLNLLIVNPIVGLLSGLPTFIASIVGWLIYGIVIGVPLVYCLIYRGYIFKILSVSSRRKREYMRNIYGE